MMPEGEFIIAAFCLPEEIIKALELPRLRRRGFPLELSNSEVITIEIVGEFLGQHLSVK